MDRRDSLLGRIRREIQRFGVSKKAKEAGEWFMSKIRQAASQPRGKYDDLERILHNKDRQKGVFEMGKMYAFYYDPKHKATLPYYDLFPLIFPYDSGPGYFMGLNLHYLPPVMRAKFLNALSENKNNDKYDETTKLRISYAMLKGAARYRMFKPCIKMYLTNHVRSKFIEIPANEWDLAIMLPTEQFEKASKHKVWRDSEGMI